MIDVFCHAIPKEFAKAVLSATLLGHGRDHRGLWSRFFEYGPTPNYSQFSDPAVRIRHMDKFGISMQLISLGQPPAPVTQQFVSKEVVSLTKLANDAIAKMADRYQDRLKGIATIPFLDGEALDELRRCIEDLGMKGVQIYSNVDRKPLDSPEFLDFYSTMHRYDLPILIHPTDPITYPWLHDYRLLGLFGWPFDTSIAMSRLVYGGILKRFPNLKVVTHHLGAMIPYFAERIRGFNRLVTDSSIKDPIRYFKMFYNDTAISGWTPGLMCGYEFFGPKHIVFATDYPFGPDGGIPYLKDTIQSVKRMKIPDQEKKEIFEGNSARLFRLN